MRMDKNILFDCFTKLNEEEKVHLLKNCYESMNTQQRSEVFGDLKIECINKSSLDGKIILESVIQFKKESLRGDYYAPFDINSKNYMYIPEETELWFEKLAELLLESSRLTELGQHDYAIRCFTILFDCINEMESGKEIIFADEYGIWMLPTNESACIKAYIQSAAAILNPEEYVKTVLLLIKRDSHHSFCNKVYKKAIHMANDKQKNLLSQKMQSENIKTY